MPETQEEAGLVILELSQDWEMRVEQVDEFIRAIRISSSIPIGIAISLQYPQQQLTGKEQTDQAYTAVISQLVSTIEADLLVLDGTLSHVPPPYLLDMVRAVSHHGEGKGAGNSRQTGQGQALPLPVLAVYLSTSGESESVADDEVIAFARLLKQHGCDLIIIATEGSDQLRQRLLSDRVRNEVGIPTMLVRETASADEMNTNILAGRTDLYLLRHR